VILFPCVRFNPINLKKVPIMKRLSKNSKYPLENETRRPDRRGTNSASLQDQLLQIKLRIEQEKLAKIEEERREAAKLADMKYMRYEDMPPPTPDQEAEFLEQFKTLIGEVQDLEHRCPHCQKILPVWEEDYKAMGMNDPLQVELAEVKARLAAKAKETGEV